MSSTTWLTTFPRKVYDLPRSKPFWAWWDITDGLLRGSCISHLYEHLSGAGTSEKNKHVKLVEDTLGAFKILKKACLRTSVLAFADFNKPFLLETDGSKLGLEAVLSQKQTDGLYHPVAYASTSLTVHECNYHLTKQEFLVLKWAVMEQFQEYLLWKPSVVKTWQQPAHLYHDHTQFNCLTLLGRITYRIHL